jgi:dCMP deaminase
MTELIRLREDLHREPDFAGNLPDDIRPDWDTYFIEVCFTVANRSDCTRSRVGAVITDRYHRIMATGYTGAPAGQPGCLAGACPRGRHYLGTSVLAVCGGCGLDWPCPDSPKPGSGTYEDCISVHAEANAIIYAGRDRCIGGTIYVTREPCSWCGKMIAAAGITRIVIP